MDFEAEDKAVTRSINAEAFKEIDAAAQALIDKIDSSVYVIVNEDAVHITRITMVRAVVINFLTRGKAKKNVAKGT